MRQARQGFKFRGFVALADMLFALSTGLLLLNPIRFDSRPAKPMKPVPEQQRPKVIVDPARSVEPVKPVPEQPRAQVIILEVQKVEEHLNRLESDEKELQSRAIQVLKTE